MENLDGAGNLLATETDAAAYRYHYHPDGRFLRWEVLDTEGKPAIGPTNTSGEDNHYVDLNFTAITFFDQKGQKTLHASGAAAWQFESDTYGNIIRVSFQGLDGKLIANRSAIFQRSYTYNTAGQYLVAITNEDQSGQPINSSDGYAIEEIERGSKGLVMRRTYRNAQGVCVSRTSNGIAYITYTYDANGKCIAQMGYDTNNKQVSEDRYP